MLRPYRTRSIKTQDFERRFSHNLAPVGARKATKSLPCLHLTFIQQTLYNVYINNLLHTTRDRMTTNIIIDDQLMADALKATGLKTKQEVVELGLKTLIRLKQQEKIKAFKGKLKWEGNLEEMRHNQ